MVLSPPLACSQYFSPRFLQPHKILLCQPPSAPSLCSLPLLMLNVKPCCWCTSLLKELLPYTVPPGHKPARRSPMTAHLAPPSLRLPGHCSTFNSSPCWLSSTAVTFPFQSGQQRYPLLFWNRAENSSLWEIPHVLHNPNLNHISLSYVFHTYLPLKMSLFIPPLLLLLLSKRITFS